MSWWSGKFIFILWIPCISSHALWQEHDQLFFFTFAWTRNTVPKTQLDNHMCHLWFVVHDIPINSWWPSDAIWQQRPGPTLSQVMAWCLMAPSHYLNQCWPLITEVLWYTLESNFTSPKLLFSMRSLKMTFLKSLPCLPGTNKLDRITTRHWEGHKPSLEPMRPNYSAQDQGKFIIKATVFLSGYTVKPLI